MDGHERDAEGVFREEAVLILAPDAALSRKVLEDAGMECAPCRDIGDLCAGIDDGAGIAVLARRRSRTRRSSSCAWPCGASPRGRTFRCWW